MHRIGLKIVFSCIFMCTQRLGFISYDIMYIYNLSEKLPRSKNYYLSFRANSMHFSLQPIEFQYLRAGKIDPGARYIIRY